MTIDRILVIALILSLLSTLAVIFLFPLPKTEGFLPRKVKEMYRPMERKVRQTYHGVYSQAVIRFSRVLRNIGFV